MIKEKVDRLIYGKEGALIKSRDPLKRAIKILHLMMTDPGEEWGVRQISNLLDMAPSTVHRILVALNEEGLLDKTPTTGRYMIGLELLRMLWKAESRVPIRRIALPHMQNVVAKSNETVLLGLYDPARMQMFFSDSVDSKHTLRYVVPLSEWIPVYCGASGMAIMAFLPAEERRQIVERTGLAPITEFTITDPSVLESELEKIRRQGFAITYGQRISGAVGIAAPFLGSENLIIGDLVFTIPEQRFEKKCVRELAQLLIDHAKQISTEIQGPSNKERL